MRRFGIPRNINECLKLIRRPHLALLTFLGLHFFIQVLLPTHLIETDVLKYYDPTFQFQPIRTLFPALAMLFITQAGAWRIISRHIIRPLISFVLGLGILWNLDAGLPAFGAWLLFLCYVTLLEQPASLARRLLKSLRLALETLAAAALAIFLFSLLIKLKSGSFPDFSMATRFHQQFYISGFFMLPMRQNHSWILLAAIYLVVLSFCIGKLFEKPEAGCAALAGPLFGMVILALGLFAYYQGRSHYWPGRRFHHDRRVASPRHCRRDLVSPAETAGAARLLGRRPLAERRNRNTQRRRRPPNRSRHGYRLSGCFARRAHSSLRVSGNRDTIGGVLYPPTTHQ